MRISSSALTFADNPSASMRVPINGKACRATLAVVRPAGTFFPQGDFVQLAVATGHAAIAATTIHNSLGRNPR
jgi:hypothetical protein